MACDDGRAERKPAIIRRNSVVDEDLESVAAQARNGVRQQPQILKSSTAEAYARELIRAADSKAGFDDRVRDREVESSRDDTRWNAVDDIPRDVPDGGPEIDLTQTGFSDVEWVRIGGIGSGELEFDRGLSLVRRVMTNAQHG